jgi:pimeloyl-ACP methyl ester carboxylesterase
MVTTATNSVFSKTNETNFLYQEAGSGPTIVLLHGLFGGLSNWQSVLDEFSDRYHLLAPQLPIYESSNYPSTMDGMLLYLEQFLAFKKIKSALFIGNSLGGQLALMFSIKFPKKVTGIILAGSAGLYENAMGQTFPKRNDYRYVKERVSFIFHRKEVISESLIQEVYTTTQSIAKSLRIVKLARSAQQIKLADALPGLKIPTLLIWGIHDQVTPPSAALHFKRLLPVSYLRFIDDCGHVPMMEQPVLFNRYVREFLNLLFTSKTLRSSLHP